MILGWLMILYGGKSAEMDLSEALCFWKGSEGGKVLRWVKEVIPSPGVRKRWSQCVTLSITARNWLKGQREQ